MLLLKRKKYREMPDLELIALLKGKDASFILGILYERYSHLVMGVGLKYLKNETDAEDITMQIFEHLIEKINKSNIQNFSSWLYVVTKNECFMLLRKKQKVIPKELKPFEISYEEEMDPVYLEVHFTILEQAINLLKEEQKMCLKLFYLEGHNYTMVAELLDIPLLKVKSAIQNGKRNLKIELEKHHAFKS